MSQAAKGSAQAGNGDNGARPPGGAAPGLVAVERGPHSLHMGATPQVARVNPLSPTPVTGPMETQPGVAHAVVHSQVQSHQVVRRGMGHDAPSLAEGAYAPRSGQEIQVPGRVPPASIPRPQQHAPQEVAQADVTVILYSSGDSPALIAQQVQALARQSVHAKTIWVHADGSAGHDERTLGRMTVHRTPVHFGRYFRLSLARNVTTRYVAILDEDTLPGRRWLERTIVALMEADESVEAQGSELPFGGFVLAGSGSVLASDDPADVRLVGPELPRDEPCNVDFGRQSWVFGAGLARVADGIPRVGGSSLAFGFAMSAAAAAAEIGTIVLDYGVDRDDWLVMGEAQVPSPQQDVYAAYGNYRNVGWEPTFAAQGSSPGDPPPGGGDVVDTGPQLPAQVQASPPPGNAMPTAGPTQAEILQSGAAPPPAAAAPQSAGGIPAGQLAEGVQPDGSVVKRQGTGDGGVTTIERVLAPHEQSAPPLNAGTERIVGASAPPAQAGRETVLGQPATPTRSDQS